MAISHRTQVSGGNDGERPYKLAFECLVHCQQEVGRLEIDRFAQ